SVYALSKRAHSASLTPLRYKSGLQQQPFIIHTQEHDKPWHCLEISKQLAERVGFEPTSRC
ncbi:MAG: hypothetical protein AAB422_02460, partial [Planctomycetota bacterium]